MHPRCIGHKEALHPQLQNKLDTETKTRWVDPAQDSSACSLFIIPKYDKPNKARFLHNLIERNPITCKDHMVILDMYNIVNTVAWYPFRSQLDHTDGYQNILMEPDSEQFTSFYTLFGTDKMKVMQHGDCNVPATFMKLINSIFTDMIERNVYVYLDDILIFDHTMEQHIASIKEVCKQLHENNLFRNKSKTMILPDAISILGHTITLQGLSAEPDKILQVNNWKRPNTQKKL